MSEVLGLIDESKCYEMVRTARWDDEVVCVNCKSRHIRNNGGSPADQNCWRYVCATCGKNFDDLTATFLSGHRQPIKNWISCAYFMSLNLSNEQIAAELGIRSKTVYDMTIRIRTEIMKKTPEIILDGTIEIDEAYVVAGHKGNPDVVSGLGRRGRRNRLKGARGRGTLAREKPPVFGMLKRGGCAVIRMLPNFQQTTIEPLIERHVRRGAIINTDEFDIYSHLSEMGYIHRTVCHGIREFARDDDGDGVREVHTNSIEGLWSHMRSWLRPHKGISQENLPLYLAFFQFVYNERTRGKSLLPSLMKVLVS